MSFPRGGGFFFKKVSFQFANAVKWNILENVTSANNMIVSVAEVDCARVAELADAYG